MKLRIKCYSLNESPKRKQWPLSMAGVRVRKDHQSITKSSNKKETTKENEKQSIKIKA